MASPEDVERAAELAFGLFQIPAAVWHGATSAFSQAMPLTTKSYSDVYIITQMYAIVGIIIYLILLADALSKMMRLFRLMMLGRLKPWGCVQRFMGYAEIRNDFLAAHDDVLCVNVPLTGFAVQIILMFLVDVSLAFFLSIFWITWMPCIFVLMIVLAKSPRGYYEHIVSVRRGNQQGVPRALETEVKKYEEEMEDEDADDCRRK